MNVFLDSHETQIPNVLIFIQAGIKVNSLAVQREVVERILAHIRNIGNLHRVNHAALSNQRPRTLTTEAQPSSDTPLREQAEVKAH